MFRFTIRDVLWLTVVVALAVAWWVDRSQFVERNQSLAAKNEELLARLKDLNYEAAKLRMNALLAEELRGGIILSPSPNRVRPGGPPPIQRVPQDSPNP